MYNTGYQHWVRVHEGAGDAHLAHRHVDEVEGATVDRARCDDVIAFVAYVEQCEEIRRLSA